MSNKDLHIYLHKNKRKTCENVRPVFIVKPYKEYKNTQIRKLTKDEITKYMSEK